MPNPNPDPRDAAARAGHLEVGARLSEAPDTFLLATAFAHEISDGPLLYHGMSLADLAHVVMLTEQRLIPNAAAAGLLTALLDLHHIPADQFVYDAALGDVYTNREHAVRARFAEGDGWLRTGRARRESSTVGYLITARAELLALAAALSEGLETLLALGHGHLATLMPDYTYLQKAHPTTLAHYLLGFAMPMQRDSQRLAEAYARANLCPAGGGSVNGSRLNLDRARTAELLGFAGVAAHTRDAMWQPDTAVELASLATTVMVNANRLAEDLYIFATDEFGYLTLADAHSRTSVIMPQKKNPYSLAFIRGAARQLPALLQGVISTNLTASGQPDNRIFAYGDVPRAIDLTQRCLRLLSHVLKRATFHTDLMAERAGQNFSGATDLGDYLTEVAGLDPRTAHRVIGLAIRNAQTEAGAKQHIVTGPALDSAAQTLLGKPLNLPEAEIAAAQQPAQIVDSRRGVGGASPASVSAMLTDLAQQQSAFTTWLDQQQASVTQAEQTLLATAQAMIAALHHTD
jgi:argininosuccinate lyase